MDALSSQASIAGYKAVLLVANALPKLFPMMTTAAGTIPPAKVLVLGAGVAGLQAIATARRLGAVVQSYDVRPEVKEQVESLGAKFVELEIDTAEAQGKGGYAGKQSEEFLAKQREALGKVIAANDAVITTALVPGAKAPVLMNAGMVHGMAFGSVVLDMAAEQGGNVELSRPDEVVVENGVTVLGPTNLAATLPFDASQMYAKNVQNFVSSLFKGEGGYTIDLADEVTAGTLLARDGEIVNPRVREVYGLPALAQEPAPEQEHAPEQEPETGPAS
jgi:NAD(P) transhydrogenase subunit alpha